MKQKEKTNKKGSISTKSDMSIYKKAETMTTVKLGASALPIMKDLLMRWAIKGTISIKYGKSRLIPKGEGSALRNVELSMEIYEGKNYDINKIISSHTNEEGNQMFEDLKNLDKMKEELAFYKSRNLWQRIINKHK